MVSLLVLGKKTSGKMAVSALAGEGEMAGVATLLGGSLVTTVSVFGMESLTSCAHKFSPGRINPINNRYFNISCKNILQENGAS